MPLSPAITDLEQLKNHPAVARLLGWNAAAVEGARFDRDELTIHLERASIREACALLKSDPACPFNYLSDITCVDWYPAEPRFEVVYHFYSTVHGAGRVMSRTEARGRSVKDQTGKRIRQPGRVRHDEMQAWLRQKGVHLAGGDLDEAPQAYRRLPDVLKEHAGTVKIERTLRPFAVIMAGADVFDPFKD